MRYGLMGNYGAKQELRKLSTDEKVVKLRVAWENAANTFFQFQVLVRSPPTPQRAHRPLARPPQPEAENQLRLGADKEGYIELKGALAWRRSWFSLRGTSLFYFKEKGVRRGRLLAGGGGGA